MIRVVLVDDHAMVREGLRRVLEHEADVTVVGETGVADDVADLLSTTECDVVLLDVSMQDRSGLSLLPDLRQSHPKLSVLILSMHDRAEYIVEAMRMGARGYLLKDMEPGELRSAVRQVAAGQSYFPQTVTDRLSRGVPIAGNRLSPENKLALLTPRERDVLMQISKGATNQQIAEHLGIGRRTVESHREHLMAKLDIRTVAGLTRFAIDCGLG